MFDFQQLFKLYQFNVFITGGSGHLGRAICQLLTELGVNVFINGRCEKSVNSLVSELTDEGYIAHPAIFDLLDENAIKCWFNDHKTLPLHGIINCAYCGGAGSIKISDSDAYRAAYEVSIVATQRLLKVALPNLHIAFAQNKIARVINIASIYGMVSPDFRIYPEEQFVNPPYYGAIKAALLQWTKYAACEFASEGILVNSVTPGAFPSETVQDESPEFLNSLNGKIPMGRVGYAHEIAGRRIFALSWSKLYYGS